MHVHVTHADGEAKFWIEPEIEVAMNQGLSQKQVNDVLALVRTHRKKIVHAWHTHFGS